MEGNQANVSGPTGYDNGSGLASAALVAASLKPAAYDEMGCLAVDGIGALRHDVKEAECALQGELGEVKSKVQSVKSDLRESIQNESIRSAAANLNLHNRLCESEKAAIEAKYESRIQTIESEHGIDRRIDHVERSMDRQFCEVEKSLSEKIDHCCEEVQEKLSSFEKSVDEKFCESKELAREIERRTIERELQLQLKQSESEVAGLKLSQQTNVIISSVVEALGKK